MNGWMGKILRVNLTEEKVAVEDLDEGLARKFIGGRGLATKMIYDEVDPGVDPISPENKLIFATGPLTGAGPITSCRYMVVTKGYLTGAIACSNSGGNFGPELKFAGYDLIVFEGKAKEPVYLLIEDDRVEIRSARFLWGKGISETVASIREELKKLGKTDWEVKEFRMAAIGQAAVGQVVGAHLEVCDPVDDAPAGLEQADGVAGVIEGNVCAAAEEG